MMLGMAKIVHRDGLEPGGTNTVTIPTLMAYTGVVNMLKESTGNTGKVIKSH